MRSLLLLAALLAPAVAHAAPTKRVYAGIYLHDVTKLDQKAGVFDVDLELWAKWLGDLKPDQLLLANATGDVSRTLVSEESDGDWHSARWRVRGTLRGEFPLQRFPFDSQTLSVGLELPAELAELVPDLAGSGIRTRFSITGWRYDPHFVPRVGTETYRSDLGSLAAEGRSAAIHRVGFEVTLHRPRLTVALKLFLPLLIIIMVALLALFLDPKQVEARASIGVTALLSCFAFQFTIAGTLPDVAYLTIADGFFLIAYLLTSSALVVSIVAYTLARAGREPGSARLDRRARWLLPVLALIAAAVFSRPAPKVVGPTLIEPLPPMERPRSARDTLRIGTLTLNSTGGAGASAGVTWGLVHKEPDGTKHAVFAETQATVASDTLRFLANGELEVAWRLREGVKWSDGTPLTARDLQFATEVSKDPDLAEARVVSPREIVMRYGERISDALEGPSPYPTHALEAAFKQGGYAAVREARLKQPMPSVGPYRVVSFELDKRLVLAPNPHFPGPPPSIPSIQITRFADSASALAAFEKGEVDVLAPNTTTPEDTRALKVRHPDAVALRPSATFIFLAPDTTTPLLQKRSVRRALLMAIDRERILREVYGEEARLADTPVPEPIAGATRTAYDPAAAHALLSEAGAIGQELPLTYGPAAVDSRIAELIAADLRKAGLRITLHQVAKPGDLYRERSWTGLFQHALRGSRELASRSWWNVPIKDGRFVPTARTEAYDDTIAALVDRERRALYPERRDQLRDRLFAAYAERLPTLPLGFGTERLVGSPKLKDWDYGGLVRFGQALERWYFVE